MPTRRCSSCSAVVELPESVFSARCSFCDNPLVDVEMTVAAPPDEVVPFLVSRAQAVGQLKQYVRGHWFAPEHLRKATRSEELKDVMVPFYAYDALVRTAFECGVGIHWYRTETYTTYENGKAVTRTRVVQETEWFGFEGSHARRWFDHLVSASKGLPEAESNALEPYDLGRALPYAPALVAGVEAEVPTVATGDAKAVAVEELNQLEKETIRSTHLPGDRVRNLTTRSEAEVDRMRRVLLPVWVAVYRFKKGTFRLLVNGQTGEVVGTVPKDPFKWGCMWSVLLAVTLGGFLMCLGVFGMVEAL